MVKTEIMHEKFIFETKKYNKSRKSLKCKWSSDRAEY